MTREYYLTASLDDAGEVSTLLHQQLQVKDRNLHILSLDSAGLQQHRLHPATIIHKRDLVRGAELGGLVGVCIGLALFCTVLLALLFTDLAAATRQLIALGAGGLPVLFGGTLGALLGSRKPCYKIRCFYPELATGQHLLIVDADQPKMQRIKQALTQYPVIDAGEDSPLVLPFEPIRRRASEQSAA